MLSKRLSTVLLSGAAVAGLGAAANASFVVDLRATGVTGGGTVVDEKHVQNVVVGSVVTFSIYGQATGNDGSTANDGVLSFAGSLLSNGGTVLGNLSAARDATFLGTGGSNGLAQDLDADGDLDVGSNTPSASANFFSPRATGAPTPVFGPQVLVGTATFTVSAAGLTETSVNFRPRVASTAGSWFEDGSQITSSAFTAGAPVSVAAGIPEPTSLALVGLAGLGMLARRRPQA